MTRRRRSWILALSITTLACGPGSASEGESGETGETGETEGGETEGSIAPEDCTWTGDFTINSQIELSSMDEVCAVEGELHLREINDLEPLAQLLRVGGMLRLNDTFVSTLEPLAALRQVDGSLVITGNGFAPSLAGLDSLERVGGLHLNGRDSIAGLPEVLQLDASHDEHERAGLSVISVPSFSTLEQLPQLEFVGFGEGEDTLSVALADTELASLAGLESWPLEGGELQLVHLPLSSLEGFAATELEYVEFLSLHGLVDLQGMASLERTTNLVVKDNEQLESFEGLGSLEAIGALVVGGCYYHQSLFEGTPANPSLTSFAGLEGVTSVEHLLVRGQPALSSMAGLDSVESVERAEIMDNPALPAEEAAAWLEARGLPSDFDPERFCGNLGQEPCTPCP